MNQNAEFLNYLYQNSQMGITTIGQLTEKVEDPAFSKQLNSQLKEYEALNQSASRQLREHGKVEKELPKMAEMGAHMSIAMKTLKDHSPAHISEMMMQGSMMGIIEVTKNIKKYPNASPEVKQLAEKLLKTEQSNIESLKQFLA